MTDILDFKVRDASNNLVSVQTAFVRTTKGLKAYFTRLSANVSPQSVSGSGSSPGPITVSTDTAYSSPVGGVAPYTYNWTTTSPDWYAIQASSANTGFRAMNVSPGDPKEATFTVTITDATGGTALGFVNASASNFGFSP